MATRMATTRMATLWRAAARAGSAYEAALGRRPLATKMGTGLGVYFCGDVAMQRLEGREAWDMRRTGRMCAYGALWLSPFLHGWYRALDGVFKGAGGVSAVAGKLALDQTFAATTNMCMFYSINGILEGRTPAEVVQRLEDKLWPTMKSLWCVWIPVQAVNLTLVPLPRRVLVVNLVGVGWSIYLSWLGNSSG